MLKRYITRLVKHYGWWRVIHLVLVSGIITLTGVLLLKLASVIRLDSHMVDASPNIDVVTASNLPEVLQPKVQSTEQLANVTRSGLFKVPTPLRDKPIADKTIERIKSQLTLQCIMVMNGELVAYVNIKGVSLKRCKVGDTISDLFTVLNISTNSVEVAIVGHKVILSL